MPSGIRVQLEASTRRDEIESETLFLEGEERRVNELIETRKRALEEVKILERARLDHEKTTFAMLLQRKRDNLDARMKRMKDDIDAQWQSLQHLRAQVRGAPDASRGVLHP